MSAQFTITDAADVLAPYIAKEWQRDQVWAGSFVREAAAARGISTYIGEPPKMRSEEELRAAAEKRLAERRAWEASPRGRLHAAIIELRNVGFHSEAQTLTGIFDRSIGMSAEPSPQAIGAMLAVLAPINLSTARTAIEACAELLLATKREAA